MDNIRNYLSPNQFDFVQAGQQYRSLSKEEQDQLIQSMVNDLRSLDDRSKLIGICNFYRADAEYGQRVADGLGVDISEYVKNIPV
ncbi:catalase-related domain-containing protein [Paenibacillus turpanensis]|uniref:catalase-related domain-containing protein n=1 Tax=Paenibacillus turpanensis TaxID=2689078 RepID=UPI00140A652A|nr:catalase-related domain-containing protein [Paenibacillus turpanensis]